MVLSVYQARYKMYTQIQNMTQPCTRFAVEVLGRRALGLLDHGEGRHVDGVDGLVVPQRVPVTKSFSTLLADMLLPTVVHLASTCHH